jgi:hypothetical protein
MYFVSKSYSLLREYYSLTIFFYSGIVRLLWRNLEFFFFTKLAHQNSKKKTKTKIGDTANNILIKWDNYANFQGQVRYFDTKLFGVKLLYPQGYVTRSSFLRNHMNHNLSACHSSLTYVRCLLDWHSPSRNLTTRGTKLRALLGRNLSRTSVLATVST